MRKASFSNKQTIGFIVILSTICALVLSIMASILSVPKEEAKTLDRSKQLLMAAKMFSHEGYFLIEKDGAYVSANYEGKGLLKAAQLPREATKAEVLDIVQTRVVPLLVNHSGETATYQQAGLSMDDYLNEHRKSGFQSCEWLPLYEVYNAPLKDGEKRTPSCYVIPVSGFGLWDYIFGFIAIQPDGITVRGISWYEQKETPGLGANIAEPEWQRQFPGKIIFQPDSEGKINLEKAPVGITVVRGKVTDVVGTSPKAKSSVDGIAGATLTGNGVTRAYKETLQAYRPFFIRLHDAYSSAERTL